MDFLFFFFQNLVDAPCNLKKRISELRLSYKFLHFYENLGFSARYFSLVSLGKLFFL